MSEYKYDYILDKNACITSTEVDHEAALRSLDKFYGWVTSTGDLLSRFEK